MRRGIVAALALTGSLALAPPAFAHHEGPAPAHHEPAHHEHGHDCGCKPKPKPAKPKKHKAPDDSAHASGGYNSHRHHSKL